MGSLAEDEAAKRHSHAPPPAPLPSCPPPPTQQWHAVAIPFPTHQTHETVINGTTWYHQAPHPHPTPSDSPFPPPFHPRYGSLAPFNSFNFDSSPRSDPSLHRHPHPLPFAPSGGPSSDRGFSPRYAGTSGFLPHHSNDDRLHDAVAPGYAYAGADSAYGLMPRYHHNEQFAYYSYNGYARPYMTGPANAEMPSPGRSHGVIQSPIRGYVPIQREQAGYGAYVVNYGCNSSYRMPPRSIRTTGKTLRRVVAWCGMTMPVTITSQGAAVVEWIQRQSGDLFGFDLEWKPNRLKGEDNLVALLQICGPADCLIVQLLYTDMIPKLLKDFLSHATKQLGGVGIRQDVKKLERDHHLICQGQVELGLLASEKLKRDDLQGTGLKKLVDQVLGMTLVKTKKITMSNWEKEYLDDKQIEYACIDAWAAFAILHKLMAV